MAAQSSVDGNYPTGTQNVGLGDNALSSVESGANYNTAVGNRVLRDLTTGDSNTAVGRDAMLVATTAFNNTAIGQGVLDALTSGSNNTGVGRDALLLVLLRQRSITRL